MKFRAAAIAATSVGVVLLAVGPTRVFLATEDDVATPQVEVDRVSDLALPDPKASSRWRAGLVDTAEALPGEDRVRLGRPERVEYAEAAARAEQPGVVSVVGEPDERTQGGVGAVVGSGDVAALLDLDSPLRDALAGDLVGADALALGVVAVGDLPDGALVVDSGSNPARKDRLTDAAPRVAALADLWSSVRPDLRVLFTPGEPETTATPDVTGQVARTGSKAWWRSVRRAVERDLLPTLDRTRAPLADVLLGTDGLVVVQDGEAVLTARGAAYAVAARAVPPGARLLPTTGESPAEVRLYQRPDGRVSVLAWNPGPATTLTVQVPGPDAARSYEVRLPKRALTGGVLGN